MKVLNWKEKERQAKEKTNNELRYAIQDCLECIKQGVPDEGYYYDELSVYRVELGKRKKYVKFEDPGHGWLKVKRLELEKLGIGGEVSGCSYQKGDWVYLEEDCDQTLFEQKAGISREDIEVKWTNNQSRIRSYESYVSVYQQQLDGLEKIGKVLDEYEQNRG